MREGKYIEKLGPEIIMSPVFYFMISDSYFMQKAIELAALGMNKTSPNPRVGSVIVKDGKVVSEGYHGSFGGPHAEAEAISNASDNLKGATLFVTLEPCSHTGKTPPCTKNIIESGISRVVVGAKDPNPEVDGIKQLKKNGVEVTVGVLQKECKNLIKEYLKYNKSKKPYVTVKAALSLDGKIATSSGESRWISSPKSRNYTMKLRGSSDAIMVGARTANKDNPKLTYRLKSPKADNPLRVVVDGRLSIRPDREIVKEGTVIITGSKPGGEKEKILSDKGVEIIKLPAEKDGFIDPSMVVEALYRKDITSILIEGGGALIGSFLDAGEVDSIVFIYAPILIGGKEAPGVYGSKGIEGLDRQIKIKDLNLFNIGKDIVVEGRLN